MLMWLMTLSRSRISNHCFSDQSWVIDAIDNYRVKAAMIAHCSRRKQPIITIGAAGGQVDCTRVRVSDLYRTEQDALLAKTRKLLRQDYNFFEQP